MFHPLHCVWGTNTDNCVAKDSWENEKVKYFPLPGKGRDSEEEIFTGERFYIVGGSHLAGFEDPQNLLKVQHFDMFLK